MAARNLLVCGGSGFLGSHICRIAAARNWNVTSLSRSGEPTWPSSRPDWASKVTWTKADVLNPSTYQSTLAQADAVVHSMGILLEADYKGLLTGKTPLISGLQSVFSSARATPHNTVRAGNPSLSYEAMNRDSAVTLAEESIRLGRAQTFLYVSAADSFFVLPKRYITTKREAESRIAEIARGFEDCGASHAADTGSARAGLRAVFLRPSFIYAAERTVTVPIAVAAGVASMVNGAVGGRLSGVLGAAGERPCEVAEVAGAAVKALEDRDVEGVVGVRGIKELGARVWREGML